MLLLFLLAFRAAGATCPCDGITIAGSDQDHCWQIQARTGSTWGEADDSCVAVGGHLGHPSADNYASIIAFGQKESSLPVLTGIVAGNMEIPVVGALCQDNGYYGVIANTTGLIKNTPTTSTTCTYIKSSSDALVFDSCSIDANILCDRPLEKNDYCSIMANCSSTTTMFSSTTSLSSTTGLTSTTSLFSSTTGSSTATGLTTPTEITTAAVTSNISTTSTATQPPVASSSPATGGTSPITTPQTGGSTAVTGTTVTTKGLGGSGGGSGSGTVTTLATNPTTCQCPNNNNGVATTPATTTKPSEGSCSQPSGCLKYQWKIFGMCVDWRAMLALIGIMFGIFLFCCLCHCCMHAFPLPLPSKKVDYDVEKSDAVILPPPAIQPEPVYITVPEKHESVYGFHTKEIIHVLPEKPATKDVATMTDQIDELPAFLPVPVNAPVMKRKKAVKKPKKMFIPATADPIEEDVAAEIPIDIPDSPGARSVAPLGDVPEPVPMVPLNFSCNPKPIVPEPKPQDGIPPMPRTNQNSPGAPAHQRKPQSDNEEFDPSGLRSPPIPPAGKSNANAPRRMTFSPIADESEEETGARIPSPPREPRASSGGRKGNGENNGSGGLRSNSNSENRPTLKNQRLNEMSSPTPAANAPAKSPVPSSGGASNNPFANIGGGGNSPAFGGEGGSGPHPGDDVGMRAARGKLGGAVRGGGGGGEAPSGWKPWAKGGARR
ncbi:hypothetical protein L3Y34_013079 [Caenorhabditis briggsae]|uniref:Protein CBR-CWP-5 n=1 Tax=Caenorhabditis briggsae TaxID=6238 RepID=A0AAE8ZW11_CAEBR|nr:hypothetical protein L3Y34_013079 [Caenorhabditis briggsae]